MMLGWQFNCHPNISVCLLLIVDNSRTITPRQGGCRCCRSGRSAGSCSSGLGLLVLVVAILSSTGLVATYAYRNLVNSLSCA